LLLLPPAVAAWLGRAVWAFRQEEGSTAVCVAVALLLPS